MNAPGVRARPKDLRADRRRQPRGCPDHLIVAPLWVAYQPNLGTLLRTCDAVGACMAVRATPHYKTALARGDTLPRRPHIHWLHGSKSGWIEREREIGARIVAVELADDAVPLGALDAARVRTVLLLGHEHNGVPDEVWPLLDPSCLHTHGRHWRQPQRRRCRIPCALSPRWPRLRCYR